MNNQQLFVEAHKYLDLEKLYQAIAFYQNQKLTDLEKTILRGLLEKHSPKQIESYFPEEFKNIIIELSNKLSNDLQIITGEKTFHIDNIIKYLKAAGYANNNLTDTTINGGRGNISNLSNSLSLEKSLTATYSHNSVSQHLNISSDKEQSFPFASSLNIVKPESITSAQVNDFMPSISLWTRLGGMFLTSAVLIAIGLSAVTPYKTTVKAQSKIRPSGESRIVEATAEGTITDILVTPNQTVSQGDIIAKVDTSRLQTKKIQLESSLKQADLQLKQINAQIQAQNRRLNAETERITGAIISAKAELNRHRREYQDKQITTVAEVKEVEANLKSAEEELKQAETELISIQAEAQAALAALNAAKSKLTRYQTIAASGALSQNQLEEARLDVEQQQQQVIARQAAIKKQKQEISRRKQAIASVKAQLENVSTRINPLDAEVAIAQENIIQEQARGKAVIAAIKQETEALIQQQVEIEQQKNRDYQELQQVEQEIKGSIIRATAEGTILQLNLRNSGQNITVGQEIAQITPHNSSLVIKALVANQDIDKVILGASAQLKISACPYPDFGTLEGKVTQIASDSIGLNSGNNFSNNQNLENATPSFYEVEITPETQSYGNGENPCVIQPGMEGQSDIITRQETLLKYLLRKSRLFVGL